MIDSIFQLYLENNELSIFMTPYAITKYEQYL